MTPNSNTPLIAHDAGVLAGAVVLRPTAAVDRLVPLQAEPSPIGERAIAQHEILVRTLRDNGVRVTVLEPTLHTPAESLVGDAAIVLPRGAVLMRPAAVERRAEATAVGAALEAAGIPLAGRIVAPGLLDAGDLVLGDGVVYVGVPRATAGFPARSNALGRAQFAELAAAQGIRVAEVPTAPGTTRLRNVLSLVARDTAIVAPARVDTSVLAGLRLIDVPLGEEYAAGVLALGERRVLTNLRFRESLLLLRRAKIAVEAIDIWEFGKAGAGPSSLVLVTQRR